MKAPEIALLNYNLLYVHAEKCDAETDTFEAHFNIRYSMKEESTFNVVFELTINAKESAEFFKIKVQGTFSKTTDSKEDSIEGMHAAACMLYPYVRVLATQVLYPLGHELLEFPFSVPLAAIDMVARED